MKNHRFEKYIYAGITAVLVIIASILVIFLILEREAVAGFGKLLLSVLAPVIYGAVLAFLLAPIYNMSKNTGYSLFLKKIKSEKTVNMIGRTIGTMSSLLFLITVVVSLCYMIIPQLYLSILGIVDTMPQYVQNINSWLTDVFANNPPLEQTVLSVYEQAVEMARSWASENLIPNLKNVGSFQSLEKIVGGLSSSVMGIINLVKNLLIGLIVMVYLLNIKDTLKAQCKKIFYAFLPLKTANAVIDECRYIHKVFSGFIIGKLIDSLIIGAICFILMRLCKLPFELLISVIVGVTNVIPFFGPFIGAIPSAILVFLISPMQCLYFIGLILLLQQFDGNILGPWILGNSTGLSSFWVLFSILFFGGLLGFFGMIIAVPVTTVMFDLISKLQNHFLKKKALSLETDDYRDLDKVDENGRTFLKKS